MELEICDTIYIKLANNFDVEPGGQHYLNKIGFFECLVSITIVVTSFV